jgi:hypothetical protein
MTTDCDLRIYTVIEVSIALPPPSFCTAVIKAHVVRKIEEGVGIEWYEFAPSIIKDLVRSALRIQAWCTRGGLNGLSRSRTLFQPISHYLLIAAQGRQWLEHACMVHLEAELDRLAADLAVLNVACGAGARVNRRLEALAAIRALDHVKLHAARGAITRGYTRLDHWRKTVLRINAVRIG